MWRWIVGTAIVTALAAVVVTLQAKRCDNARQKCETAEATRPFTNPMLVIASGEDGNSNQVQSQKRAGGACRDVNGFLCKVLTPANLPNVYLVLVAVGGIIVAVGTLNILKEQTKVTKDNVEIIISKERARISIKPRYDDSGGSVPELPELTIEITQHGPTKAFNVVGAFQYSIETSRSIVPPMKNLIGMMIPDVIGETPEPITDSMLLYNAGRPNLENEVIQKKAFLHFFGEIAYTDVFGKSHRTSFRFIWTVESVEIDARDDDTPPTWSWEQGWEKHGPKEDNEAT